MTSTSRQKQKKGITYGLISVTLLALVFVLLETTHVLHFFQRKPYSGSSYTKGESAAQSSSTKTSGSSSSASKGATTGQPGDAKNSTGGSNNGLALVQPSGDFVSDHHPNLSGSPAPNTMTSVCTTTPGATCVISFTKDGVTKSLPTETTDRGGSAYWNWKLQDIGLTTGSWQIKATASLNGQSASTTDAMQLVVSP